MDGWMDGSLTDATRTILQAQLAAELKTYQSKPIFKNLLLAINIKHQIKIEKFSSTKLNLLKIGVKIFLTCLGFRVYIAPAPCTALVKKNYVSYTVY
jgi:hypothetical protein